LPFALKNELNFSQCLYHHLISSNLVHNAQHQMHPEEEVREADGVLDEMIETLDVDSDDFKSGQNPDLD